MDRRLGRGGFWLACAVCAAFSCSGKEREFRSSSTAGEAGHAPGAAGASSAGESNGGTPGEAGALSGAGEAGALNNAGEAGAPSGAGQAGLASWGESGASGASAAAGETGASGDCMPGDSRSCSKGGALGPCAAGTQFCTVAATWSACSVQPAASDSCEPNNDANCNGTPNQGCLCINGLTKKACGPCNDGTQVCSDGKSGQYGACQGAVLTTNTYYRDADGDGFGLSSATVSSCGAVPSGYVTQAGDCCDDGGDLAIAKTIYPGQQAFFSVAANVCGITWNYDCSSNNSIQLQFTKYVATCSMPPSSCATASEAYYDASSCGTAINDNCVCNSIGGTNTCSLYCSGATKVQGCH